MSINVFRIAIVIFGLVLAGEYLTGGPLAATRPAFEPRLRESIERVIFAAGRPVTNRVKVQDEVLVALKQSTPDSIQKPLVVASTYMPEMDNGTGMFINWIEDHPSLREVRVRNPETREEIKVTIPQSRLDEAINHEEQRIFIYRWFFTLPDGFVKGATQALEVSAPDQKIPASCYPSVFSEQDTTNPSPRP